MTKNYFVFLENLARTPNLEMCLVNEIAIPVDSIEKMLIFRVHVFYMLEPKYSINTPKYVTRT
jgi:hypothetical protein